MLLNKHTFGRSSGWGVDVDTSCTKVLSISFKSISSDRELVTMTLSILIFSRYMRNVTKRIVWGEDLGWAL